MKITIEIDDNEAEKLAWTYPPTNLRQRSSSNSAPLYDGSDINNPQISRTYDREIDPCVNCPNRPGGPNNKSGFCMCALPSMYGPRRITC